jgi:hypothetical protein
MGGKDSESTVTQENEPPDWAKPLLEMGAAEAMKFYQNGTGYNTYMGPTQAPLSPQTLSGMNQIMLATGSPNTPPITNESISSLVPKIDMSNFAQRDPNAVIPKSGDKGYDIVGGALWGYPVKRK